MRSRLALLLLLLAAPAWPAVKGCPSGTLAAAQTTAATSADQVSARAATALVFQAQNTAGTATVGIEMCCMGPCDTTAAGVWSPVAGGSMALTVSSAVVSVLNPACIYRANTTPCAGCSVTVGFACSGP